MYKYSAFPCVGQQKCVWHDVSATICPFSITFSFRTGYQAPSLDNELLQILSVIW